MTFIDVHAHVELCGDIKKVVDNMNKNNVHVVAQGLNPDANRRVIEISKKHPEIKAALGFYPIETIELGSKTVDEEIKFIRQHKKDIVAIGEVGIDLFQTQDLTEQRKNFIKFIELASDIDKPLIVHSRDAEEKCIEILEEFGAKKVVMHCFSGRFKLAERIVKNGWYLSIPTNITRSQQFQNMAEKLPLDRLFCETDSPYLNPFNREEKNEPALVVESYKKIAEIRKMKLKDVEKAIEDNYKRLFG